MGDTDFKIGYNQWLEIESKCKQLWKYVEVTIQQVGVESMKIIADKIKAKRKEKLEKTPHCTELILHAKVWDEHMQERYYEDRQDMALKDYRQEKEHLENQNRFINDHIDDWYEYHKNFLKTCNKVGFLLENSKAGENNNRDLFDTDSRIRIDVAVQKREFTTEFLENRLPEICTLHINNFQSLDDRQAAKLFGKFINTDSF